MDSYNTLMLLVYILMYLSSFGMITSYNPIFSILFMVNILILISINFILLKISYLGLIFVMIYVGAIVILFLFVVMMIPLKKVAHRDTVYLAISFYFLLFMLYLMAQHINKYLLDSSNHLKISYMKSNAIINENLPNLYDNINNVNLIRIGSMLFNIYYLYVLIVGLILLVVMVGSIFLTGEQQGKFIRKQFNTTYRQSIINVYTNYF